MQLKLYNYLCSVGLTNTNIDFRSSIYQEKLEHFDEDLGLDIALLNKVKNYIEIYNVYLKSVHQSKVELRYYQILSLYYSELYFNINIEPDFLYAQNHLAYWMATGSGKTIIMHLNILQYLSFNQDFKYFEIIMTTPGVNLINQHERELTPFLVFLNERYRNKILLTIDTTSGLLNKPHDFFSDPNNNSYKRLILVDEAHIGLNINNSKGTDGAFMDLRKRLNTENSFLFEYSATFHNINSKLEKEYEKAIVYDYNFSLFYRDGYGKDYFFQQVSDDILAKNLDDNLHHNLCVFSEKLEIWKDMDFTSQKSIFKASQFPDKPLLAFMGNTVNNKDKAAKNEDDEVSDITRIVNFLAGLSEGDKKKYKLLFNEETTGKLSLTRNPDADDEILLSYGNGGYWGIVNVGNGARFINNIDNHNVIKNSRKQIILSNSERYLFKNIDRPSSPINILIGSRKFAEGWNCFRVSVIGLINLGRSKGNKIIQIFGRGVRVKGLRNDGKRTVIEHNEDYFSLDNKNEIDKLRKLETLCVFSLKRSYLETFTAAVSKELSIQKGYKTKVNPNVNKLTNGKDLSFEVLKKELPSVKLLKTVVYQRRLSLELNNSILVEYKQNRKIKKGIIKDFLIQLDYRTNKSNKGIDIRGGLFSFYSQYTCLIDTGKIDSVINQFEIENSFFINSENKKIGFLKILRFVDKISYKSAIDPLNIELINQLIYQVTRDFLEKLKNKVNKYINNNHEPNEDL